MQISKWGNSLAVRIPSAVVDALRLKDGDEIEIHVAGQREFQVARARSRDEAVERLRRMKWTFPPGFHFSREEANER